MKKWLNVLLVVLTLGIAGCWDKDPVDVANKIGKAAGIAAELSLDESTRSIVTEIVSKVKDSATLIIENDVSDAVNNIVTEVTNKLVEEGKINEGTKFIITKVGNVLATGIEYMFDKHPDWKDNVDTASKVVAAFCDGALSVICSDCDIKLLSASNDYDKEAYKYFKSLK